MQLKIVRQNTNNSDDYTNEITIFEASTFPIPATLRHLYSIFRIDNKILGLKQHV